MDTPETKEIGHVVATEKKPNTAYTFSFWTNVDEDQVGIGTLVRVESAQGQQVYGTVVEAHGFNDLGSPLHELMASGGRPEAVPPTVRPEIRVYLANVLRRYPEEPISAAPIGKVYLAEEEDVQRALRTDGYADAHGIPAGCYGPKEMPLAVHLHSQFLLGPESGHLNMTGTSGLAAKTSFILFLLQSIFTHYKDETETGEKGVAALLFNTKGGDLLYLDKPAKEGDLSDLDRALYDACGIVPGPFAKVRYYAPYADDMATLDTLRNNKELENGNPTRPLTFGLREIVRHMEVMLNRDDLDAKADGYLQYLNEEHVVSEGEKPTDGKVNDLESLVRVIQSHIDAAREKGGNLDGHSIFTIRKMYNRLNNLERRFRGLIQSDALESQFDERGHRIEPGDGPHLEQFEDRTVYVVDVSRLTTEEQDLVFAAFITKLRERMESQTLGVGRLVVMIDELNKYAPSGGIESYVVKSLREIAARGRYLGLTLFGAQQFRSRVDKEIVGNAATHAFGHVEVEELSQPGYSYFSPAIREKLGALQPGEILIKHPHFAQPIFLRFPKPSVLKGSEGMRQFRAEERLPLREIILRLCLRHGLEVAKTNDQLGNRSDKELLKIVPKLRRARNRAEAERALRAAKPEPGGVRGEGEAVFMAED